MVTSLCGGEDEVRKTDWLMGPIINVTEDTCIKYTFNVQVEHPHLFDIDFILKNVSEIRVTVKNGTNTMFAYCHILENGVHRDAMRFISHAKSCIHLSVFQDSCEPDNNTSRICRGLGKGHS